MGIAERIADEVRTLPENDAREVLDFVGYLKAKRAAQNKGVALDMSEFDQFGKVFDGRFDRDECYDRPILR